MPIPRAQRRAAAQDAILRAARDVVAEGGYGAASITEVARRAGVATGSIYRHFPSKGELFAEVFRAAAGAELALVAGIAEDASRPPTERLAAALEAFARRALAAPTLAWALMAEPVDPAVEAARLENKRAYRDVFTELLREGVAARELRPLDAPVAASAIVGAFQEALIGPLADHTGGDALVASLVTFALHAVAAEEERHGRRAASVDHA
ncbi:MAG TPA: TetR/AcrR family transcriptional regulator [Solirubrobacteraceae bacterium]|nr:TetR/AcrR family transcriptional regulator [Solirubrobacteraceae bacterium]